MVDIATLAIEIDTTDVAKAETDLGRLADKGAKAEQAAGKIGAAFSEASTKVGSVAGAADKAGNALEQLGQKAAEAGRSGATVGSNLQQAAAGMSGVSGAATAAGAALSRQQQIMQQAGLSAGQYSQAMRMLPAQLTDVVTSVASGMPIWMVAIQQGGQVKDSFNGIGNAAKAIATAIPPAAAAMTGLAAVAATVAYGFAKGEAETAAFQRSIILTGNAAGTTADQLSALSLSLSGSTATQGEAAAALATIAGTGKIAADQIQAVGEAALAMSNATGRAVEDTVKEFVKLAESPAEASAKLNEQYNYLTASVYEQIRALEEQGRTTEAAKLATDTYANALQERTGEMVENLGYVERGWNAIAGAAKYAIDATLGFGRNESRAEQIAVIESKLAEAYSNLATAYRESDKEAGRAYIERLNRQKLSLQLAQQEEGLQGALDAERKKRERDRINEIQEQDRAAKALTNAYEAQLGSAQRLSAEDRARNDLKKAGIALDSEQGAKILQTARAVDEASAAAEARTEAERNATRAVREAEQEERKRLETIQRVRDTLLPGEAAQRRYNEQIAVMRGELAAGAISAEEYVTAIDGAWKALNKAEFDKRAREQKELARSIKEASSALDQFEDRLDPNAAAMRRYNTERAKLNEIILKGGENAKRAAPLLAKLDAEQAQNMRRSSEWAQWTESALERVDDAFASAWRNIGDGFDGFKKSLTNAFRQMLAELAHMAITKPIVMQIGAALGIGGGSGGGILSSLGGESSGGGFSLGNLLNYASTGYSVLTGVGPAISAGWQSGGLTGAISGGAGYYGNLASNAWGAVSGWFGGGAAGSSAAGAGFGLGQGALVSGEIGSAVYAGAKAGTTAGVQGVSSKISALANPAFIAAGAALAVYTAYDAQKKGYRVEASRFDDLKLNYGLGSLGGVLEKPVQLFAKGIEEIQRVQTQIFGNGFIGRLAKSATTLIGMGLEGLFGGGWQTKYTEQGLQTQIRQGDVSAQDYYLEVQKRKGGLLGKGGKRTLTSYSAASDETVGFVNSLYAQTTDKVFNAFESLGIGVNDSILKGLNVGSRRFNYALGQKKVAEEIEKWFNTTVSDSIVRLSGQGIYKRELQGLKFKDVEELSTALVSVNAAFKAMGTTLFDGSIAGAKLAKSLQDAAGGMDKLAELQDAYYSAFYSEAEQYENQVKSLIEQFGDLGLVMPTTAEGFRELVDAQDLTTTAGQQMYLTLLSLAPEMAAFTESLLSVSESLAQSRGAALSGLTEAYQRQATELQQVVNTFDLLAGSLAAFRADIEGAVLAIQSPLVRLDFARGRFEEIAAAAAGGDKEAMASLPGAGKDYAQAALASANTRADYVRELSRIQQATDAASSKAVSERDVAAKQLEAIESSLKELGVVSDRVMSVEEALKAFEVADKAYREELLRQLAGTTESIIKALDANSPRDLAAAIQQGFASLDANLDGLLTADELRGALDGKATDDQIEGMIDRLDANSDGLISALELQALQQISAAEAAASLIIDRLAANDPEGLQAAITAGFELLDANADGMLTAEELRAALADKSTDKRIEDVIDAIDGNKDGAISSGEASGPDIVEELKYVQGKLDLNRDGTINGFEDLISEQATVTDALSLQLKNQMTDLKLTTLTKAQMEAVLDAPGEDIEALLRAADKNGDGVLKLAELDAWRNQRLTDLVSSSDRLAELLRNGFAGLDTRLDGQLTKAEIQNAILKDLGVKISAAQAGKVIGSVDESNNGTITEVDLITQEQERQNALDLAAIIGELDAGKISNNAMSVFGSKIQTATPNFGGYGGVSEAKLERAIAEATGVALEEFKILSFADIQALAKNLGISKGEALGLGENVLNDTLSAKSVDSLDVAVARALGQKITEGITLPASDVKGFSAYKEEQLENAIADKSGVPVSSIELLNKNELIQIAVRMKLRSNEIPAFARGGWHAGGLRIVGENGPEIEATGASRIYSASQTAQMLRGGPDTSAMDKLSQAVSSLGDGIRAIAKHTMQTARRVEFLERWDFDGLPEPRGV